LTRKCDIYYKKSKSVARATFSGPPVSNRQARVEFHLLVFAG
jgi:hypothetical protein